ncbi:MAG: hypothetical protein JXN10_11595 [Clostridia bacterium]|nr:hypothetical protein [Clostridia bacterium]MBN2884164.1 hypothetical protein [Clostridia bacterium]
MRKNVLHILIAFTAAILLLFISMPITLAQPTPYPPPGETYPPLPKPSPVPSPNGYKEEDISENISSFGGLDSNESLIAIGYTGDDTGIAFYNGDTWNGFNTYFTPTGIEWSKKNDTIIFVSDNESSLVLKGTNLTQAGANWVEIGSQGSEPGQFNNPHGMYINSDDELYVVDTGNNRIQMWNGFDWLPVASPQYSEYMVDICIFENTTYITDNSRNCIYYKTPEETGWNIIVNPTYINCPSFMDIDEDGNIYFLSWVIFPDGPHKNIVRFSNGEFSVYVQTGSGPGYLENESTSEELCVTYYGGLVYSDSSTGSIYRELCNDNTLKELTVNGISLELDVIENNYEINFDDSIKECLVVALPQCRGTLINGTGNFPLSYGLNEITITCTSESGLSRQYNLNVIRDMSGNAQLLEIFIDGSPLEGFESDIYIYNDIGCPFEKESLTITGYAVNSEAILIGEGAIPMTIGVNSVLLTVISQNGININNYLLNITRSGAKTEETPTASPAPSPIASETPTASPAPSPIASETPGTTVSQPPVPSPTPTSLPLPSDGLEIPVNLNPTHTPPIDRTPTPTPDFSTFDPWKKDFEKDMDEAIAENEKKEKLNKLLTYAGIAVASAAACILSYLQIRKKKKKK